MNSYEISVVFNNSVVGTIIVYAESEEAAIEMVKEFDYVTSAYAARVYL